MKHSILAIAFIAACLFPSFSMAEDISIKDIDLKISQLKKERVDIARKSLEITKAQYDLKRMTIDAVRDAQIALNELELEYAESGKDKSQALQSIIKTLKDQEKDLEIEIKYNTKGNDSLDKVKSKRMGYEITLFQIIKYEMEKGKPTE